MTTIAAISCFAIGVYTGKKRANGRGWTEIAGDFCHDAKGVALGAWSAVSAMAKPFRGGKGNKGSEQANG